MVGRTVDIGGRMVRLAPQDDTFYLTGDMSGPNAGGAPRSCRCTADGPLKPAEMKPNPYVRAAHRALAEAYGNSAILAWDNDQLVGFVDFFPLEAQAALDSFGEFFCLQVWGPEPDRPLVLPAPRSRVLRVHCMNVAPGYREQGLGKALASYFLDWAREQRWRRVEVYTHSGFLPCQWWRPAKPFWEELGFRVGAVLATTQPLKDVWRQEWEKHKGEPGYPLDPPWEQIDRDYLMSIDL